MTTARSPISTHNGAVLLAGDGETTARSPLPLSKYLSRPSASYKQPRWDMAHDRQPSSMGGAAQARRRPPDRPTAADRATLTCARCELRKPVDSFRMNGKYRSSYCHTCAREV